MNSLPSGLFRREMGWPAHLRPYDYSRLMKHFDTKPEDRVIAPGSARNDIIIFDEHGLEINPVYSMDYSTGIWSNVVAVGYESGFVSLVDTQEDAKKKVLGVHQFHDSAVFSISWSPLKPQQLVTGSGDQTVKVWDCNTGFKPITTFKGHERTVKKAVFHPTQPEVICSASRDGTIRIWDTRSGNKDPENYITFAHSRTPKRKHAKLKETIKTEIPVTDLVFKDEFVVISCGSHDGYIKFWDLRRTYKVMKKKYPVREIKFPLKNTECVGFSSLLLDKAGNNLFAASATREIFKFNLLKEADVAGNDIPDCTFENEEPMLFDLKMSLSSCGRYLGCGSRSTRAHIWDTWNASSVHPIAFLNSEANCVMFSKEDPLKVVTGDDNGRVSIWRVDLAQSERQISCRDSCEPAESPLIKSRYLLQEDKYPSKIR